MNILFLISICTGRRTTNPLPSPMLSRCAQLAKPFTMKIQLPNFFTALLFLLVLIFGTYTCYSQISNIRVTKKTCTYDKKYSGHKLFIECDTDTGSLKSEYEYWLDNFITLPDTVKLLIIEKLLEYESDTSLCCFPVVNRSFNGIEGCRGYPKGVERYTLQVDALFMINSICWPKLMELYSCTPVLFDSKAKKAINGNQAKIKQVFAEYRKWFEESKIQGRIRRYFPFNDGRYIWYGGRKSITPKDS